MKTNHDTLRRIKILMLEDQEDDADLVKRSLRKGGIEFEAVRVDDRVEFEKALENFKPDAILSDHALPQFNSIEALKIRMQKSPDTPFILITGAVSDEFAAQCIKLGADDYILKSNLSRLPASLKNAMEHHALEMRRAQDAATLREQNVRLTKVNKEIDSFVYSVSHNLRSPLASVLGLVQIARYEMNTEKFDAARYFNMIERSILKLDDTIKEILEYSRNERTEVHPERIDMNALVTDCLERIQYLKGFDTLEKIIDIKEKAPFYSDAYRLTIVLSNLFSNAVKYMDESRKPNILQITVLMEMEKTTIEVMDNGVGIAPGQEQKIFNMFYRGTEKSDGAGLGLYIVKEMLKRLGGLIYVSSDPGLQTTFTVTLPNLRKAAG
jgi:signal transduction histidine kinase